MTKQHLAGLDILRILSALGVMAFHFCFRAELAGNLPAMDLPHIIKTVASYGYLGVHVFFVISGFVIAYSAEDTTPSQFLAARFARIYPTFVIAMTVTAVISVLSGDPKYSVSPRQYAANLIILAPLFGKPFVDGAYWSIVLEIFFYGWIFLIINLKKFDKILSICLAWIIFSFTNEVLIQSLAIHHLFITGYSGFFALGIAIRHLSRSFSFHGIVLFAVAFAYSLYMEFSRIPPFEAAYSIQLSKGVVAGCLIASIAALIFLIRINIEGRLQRVAVVLGGATYPQYLSHQNIGYLAIAAVLPHMSAALAVILVSAVVIAGSVIFCLLIEQKLRNTVRELLLRLST